MPAERINLGGIQASGDAELAGASPLAINVVVDGAGAVRRRPGIAAWDGFPSTIPDASDVLGMHAFEDELYYVTDRRNLFKVSAGATTALSTGALSTQLDGTARPVFADTPYRIVVAGGGAPQRVESAGTVSARLGGSPPDSTSIVAMASRLFSNDLTDSSTIGQMRYSEIGSSGEQVWDTLRYATAEAEPDEIVTARSNSNELWAFGERTLQVFSPDPISVIAPGASRPVGCAAPHSVIRLDDRFAWLDNQRRFVISDGRGYEEISGPIAGTLDGITTVSDCYGFRVNTDQFDCLVWVFPTDGRSFCYQGGGWSQWQGWTTNQGFSALAAKSHYYWEDENVHLVGLASGGIGQFSTTATDDDGARIKALVRTGFLNHDTDAEKMCQELRITIKRGQTATGGTLLVSWRDTLGDFCSPLRIEIGTTGDYIFTVRRHSLGTYRARQWQFEFSDAADLVVARVEETFTVGGY